MCDSVLTCAAPADPHVDGAALFALHAQPALPAGSIDVLDPNQHAAVLT